MNNLCLVPLIGLPASGKTTTALELVKYCSNISFIYISYDVFQSKLNFNVVDYKSGKYKLFREYMLKFIARIVTTLRNDDTEYSNTGKLLIQEGIEWQYQHTKHSIVCLLIDDNHYYRSMRYEVYQLAKTYRTGFVQIYFPATLEKSIFRNLKRCLPVPEDILKAMNTRLEPPHLKNHWEKWHYIVNIDENEINFQNIYQLISKQTANPEKLDPKSEVPVNIPPSQLHEIDLYLRKLISQYLKYNATDYRPNELNEKRKRILADLRSHIIEIPINLDELQQYFQINK